ncbi:MAG: CzcE family metal-binding protein [Roseateles sp.]|jgi:co-chaperonin GroES (HSP10)
MKRLITKSSLILSLAVVSIASSANVARNETMANGKSVHGQVVAQSQHDRVVNVDAQKSINVDCGDVVTFKKSGQSFTWKFDSVRHGAVDLRTIAPAGFTDQKLTVYVSRSEAEGA